MSWHCTPAVREHEDEHEDVHEYEYEDQDQDKGRATGAVEGGFSLLWSRRL